MRVADFVAQSLIQSGVSRVYGLTGRGSIFLTDGVARSQNLRFIPALHEQSCGFAAEADSLLTGQPSVVMVSTGAGATNVVTSTLSAWQNQTPVFFLSGQNSSKFCTALSPGPQRTYGEQEFDVAYMVKGMTKYSKTLEDPSLILEELSAAFEQMLVGRPGPVWLDIPLDFQSAHVALEPMDLRPRSSSRELDLDLASILPLELQTETLVILGNSLLAVDREILIQSLKGISATCVVEPSLTDLVPYLQNCAGVLSTPGTSPTAFTALKEAERIVSIGSSMRLSLRGEGDLIFEGISHFIHFDFAGTWMPIRDDIKFDFYPVEDGSSFVSILQHLKGSQLKLSGKLSAESLEGESSANSGVGQPGLDLEDVFREVNASLGFSDVVVTDSGTIEVMAPSHLMLPAGARHIHPFSQGAMGWALGAAIGALSSQSKRVTVIVGDGSTMMNLQELEVIRTYGGRATVILIDNGMYGIIRKRQNELFRGRTIGTDSNNGLTKPNWRLIAEAFDYKYSAVSEKQGLSRAIKLSSSLDAPSLIAVQGKKFQGYSDYTQLNKKRF